MSYKVKTISHFERQAKRLIKKFPSLKNELAQLGRTLKEHPQQGAPLGNDCYKIRLPIASKGKGKSGGSRVITHIAVTETAVYFLSIYDKSEQATVTDKELKELLKQIK